MTRTRHLATGFLSLSAAALLAVSAAGGAAAGPAAASEDKARSTVSSAVLDSTGAAEYWTEERMRNAIPGDALAAKAFERRNPSSQAAVKGKEKTVDPTKEKKKTTIAADEAPVSSIGKVFVVLNGADYVCSGNAVTSGNQSTVVTAAHCLTDGPIGPSNFIFVPGYENGYAPKGEWEGRSYFVPQRWTNDGDFGVDTGFAVVNKLGGENLTQVVGGTKVVFNEPPLLDYKIFGYPADKPFDGQALKSCTGTAAADTTNPQFGTQGITCDMKGGSSGGPWLIQGGNSAYVGYQNSINSFSYKGSNVMYGPYWGQEIQDTYTEASKS